MSQQSVKIVQAMYEGANAGDKLDANFEVLAPDVEFHVSGAFPDLDRVYRGHEGVKKLNDALNEPWVALSLDPEEFIDAGSRVLVLSRFHARGRESKTLAPAPELSWQPLEPASLVQTHWIQSGRLDLNQRPFGPQPNALPGCATPRSGRPDSNRR